MKTIYSVFLGAILALAAAGVADAQVRTPAGFVPLELTLKLHNTAQLEALIASQSNPRSPMHGRFLTVQQFRNAFAPTPREYEATIARLRSMGFTIVQFSPNRTLIKVAAPRTLVERTFQTRLSPYADGHGLHYTAAVRPTIPKTFPEVQSLLGVAAQTEQLRTAYSMVVRGTRMHAAKFTPVGPDGGFSPAALTLALDFPIQHSVDGTGVKVADVIDGEPVATDLSTFYAAFGIAPTGPPITIIPVDGGSGFDTAQSDIDIEWIQAVAPGASVYDYEMPFLGNMQIVDSFTQLVSDDTVDVVNTSFAACEVSAPDLELAILPILQQGAAEGISFENVAFGSSNCGAIPGIKSPQTPTDSADVLAVGGSNIISNSLGALIAETGFISSGGGVSIIVPVLPEQVPVKGIDQSGRNTPDIVTAAEINGAGPSVYYFGSWAGGSPFVNNAPMAGVLAEYQQTVGHRLGAFDHTLYSVFQTVGYKSVFHDVTVGCNGRDGNKPICAKRNYDLTTGLGSADMYQLGLQLH